MISKRGITAITRYLTGLALLSALWSVPAADNGHQHAGEPVQSLLEACRGAWVLPSPDCGSTPTPAFDQDGRLWLVFTLNGHLYVTHSGDLGRTFTQPVAVNRVPEAIYHDGENRPKLVIGPQGGIYVSWSQRIPGKYSGHIRFSRSLDGAGSFALPQTVNDDLAPISHRFESMAIDSLGRVHIVWIDKRDLMAAKQSGTAYAGASLYHAVSNDQGQSFAFNQKVAEHSCECCRIAMAADSNGRMVLLWRQVFPVNIRDHAIIRLEADTPPVSGPPLRATDDGWMIEGCPHHGPDLALDDSERVHMAWFTQGEKNRGIMYGRFDLSTETLEFQHSMDTSSSASRPQVAVASDRVFMLWKSFNGTTTQLRLSTSSDAGVNWSASHTLATTADGSDYPILITHGGAIFVSWHTRAEGYRLIPIPPAQP